MTPKIGISLYYCFVYSNLFYGILCWGGYLIDWLIKCKNRDYVHLGNTAAYPRIYWKRLVPITQFDSLLTKVLSTDRSLGFLVPEVVSFSEPVSPIMCRCFFLGDSVMWAIVSPFLSAFYSVAADWQLVYRNAPHHHFAMSISWRADSVCFMYSQLYPSSVKVL